MITVYYNGKPYQYADSTKYLELARTLQPQFEHDIVLASVNGKLQELWKYIKDGASVSFLQRKVRLESWHTEEASCFFC